MNIRLTHIGTATALLEIGSLRLLTDPALDAAGARYDFGFGASSRKLIAPVLPPEGLGRIDAVLLSHAHHGDNFDDAGRLASAAAGQILTTRPAARALGGHALGLADFESHTLRGPDGFTVKVTATPARHGPACSLPVVGRVIGFVLEWPGQRAPLYISGDTVYFGGIDVIARRFGRIGTALLHLGGVRFATSGPLRYTFDAAEALRAADRLQAERIVPLHFSGWQHFRQGEDEARAHFVARGQAGRLLWLAPGRPTELDV